MESPKLDNEVGQFLPFLGFCNKSINHMIYLSFFDYSNKGCEGFQFALTTALARDKAQVSASS
jgi:hypothetical protein